MNLPETRNDLIVQELHDELLVYDLSIHKSYCLNNTAKIIFNACNGTTTLGELKSQNSLSDEMVFFSLDELKKNNLLEAEADYISPFAGMNRREVIRKVGFACAVALPVVSSLIAPKAINAASSCVNVGGISPGSPVGSNRFTSIGKVCGDPSLADNGCNFTYGSQCCSGQAVGRSCIQDVKQGVPSLAVYNCKCA